MLVLIPDLRSRSTAMIYLGERLFKACSISNVAGTRKVLDISYATPDFFFILSDKLSTVVTIKAKKLLDNVINPFPLFWSVVLL